MGYEIIAGILLAIAGIFLVSGSMGLMKYQHFLLKGQAVCLIVVVGQTLVLLAMLVHLRFTLAACRLMIIMVLNIIAYLSIVHLLLRKYSLESDLLNNLQELNVRDDEQ